MTNLKKLNARFGCGIGPSGIRGLQLEFLYIYDNENFTRG